LNVTAKSKHEILVKREDLTTTGLRPSSQELYDLMHLISCEHAIKRWNIGWSFCPVCLGRIGEDGITVRHRPRKEIEV
ncbi:MAG: hypothetical protein V4440_03030, partial [Pseudomonadota bacterium]